MQIIRSVKESENKLCPFLPALEVYQSVGIIGVAKAEPRLCQTVKCMAWVPHDKLVNQGSCALIKIDKETHSIGKNK